MSGPNCYPYANTCGSTTIQQRHSPESSTVVDTNFSAAVLIGTFFVQEHHYPWFNFTPPLCSSIWLYTADTERYRSRRSFPPPPCIGGDASCRRKHSYPFLPILRLYHHQRLYAPTRAAPRYHSLPKCSNRPTLQAFRAHRKRHNHALRPKTRHLTAVTSQLFQAPAVNVARRDQRARRGGATTVIAGR